MCEEDNNMAKRLKYRYHRNGTIPQLPSQHVFVFGSNERGLHRNPFSEIARVAFGAEDGVYLGITGRSYAIPTTDRFIRVLTLRDIQKYVAHFVSYTHSCPDVKFWVTDLNTEKLSYKPYQLAPLFRGCFNNCNFPQSWKPWLK